MQYNLINDLSNICNIPATNLEKLQKQVNYIICEDVLESTLNTESITTIDIGIGKLLVKVIDDAVAYKFIPSESLVTSVKKTINDKKSPLQNEIEKAIAEKLLTAYKDFF